MTFKAVGGKCLRSLCYTQWQTQYFREGLETKISTISMSKAPGGRLWGKVIVNHDVRAGLLEPEYSAPNSAPF